MRFAHRSLSDYLALRRQEREAYHPERIEESMKRFPSEFTLSLVEGFEMPI